MRHLCVKSWVISAAVAAMAPCTAAFHGPKWLAISCIGLQPLLCAITALLLSRKGFRRDVALNVNASGLSTGYGCAALICGIGAINLMRTITACVITAAAIGFLKPTIAAVQRAENEPAERLRMHQEAQDWVESLNQLPPEQAKAEVDKFLAENEALLASTRSMSKRTLTIFAATLVLLVMIALLSMALMIARGLSAQ